MSKVTSYLFFILFIGAGIYILHFFEEVKEEEHPGTTDLTLETDLHLNNAKILIKEKSIERSLYHLQKAIHSIEMIEEIADSASIADLDRALRDLKLIIQDVEHGRIDTDDINHKSILALNAVASAQLRLSEKYLISGQKHDAEYALKYASEHLHNALKFASSEELAEELIVYRHIDSLVHSKLDPSQISDIENTISDIHQIK